MQLIFGATVADTDTDTDALLNSWQRCFVFKSINCHDKILDG